VRGTISLPRTLLVLELADKSHPFRLAVFPIERQASARNERALPRNLHHLSNIFSPLRRLTETNYFL
jgi:hypothetical protein